MKETETNRTAGRGEKRSRRDVLRAGAILAGGLAAGMLQGCATGNEDKDQPVEKSRTPLGAWDKEYDVIVVGSGFAGMAAAIEARKAGAEVLVVEKMPVYGGNSAINGGAFAVAGSPLQEKEGVKDSVELMVQDMLKAGRGLNHMGLLKIVAAGTRPAYEFTLEHGVEYKPFLQHFGGHSVPRTLQATISSGAGIVRPLRASAARMGVAFRNRCKLEDFVLDEDGGVMGIVVRDRYDFPKENSGELRRFRARRGVVMCSGGFSQDRRFRMMQDPKLDEKVDSTNQPGATAEGLQAMFAVGAAPVQINLIQLGPWSSPDEAGFGMVSQFNTIAGFPNGIMVDVRTGKRFVNELGDRKERAEAILARKDEQGNPVYPVVFCTAEGASRAQTLEKCLEFGVAWQFDTLEALAAHFGMPAAGLAEEVALYDEGVRTGTDTRFGKPMGRAIPLGKGPYYAVRCWPKVHYTMGGVEISTEAEVMHMRTGLPIAGLYAAGEVTGGPHGASRLGSCAVAETLVIGRIAGRNAALHKA
ncbi:flavocytochrome c [Desulfobaculum xiamenense]|uniref:Flavocytochrome c n=1 Tax=Desulfobaculum xiamenense TaxID=995050 RepID=A0A846QT41_9BACT|nr:flavocytochrome c [Desulfobaculum xiamenense]NJB68344.1 flavocytochrome c [Desulfobaculum xiamenense]